MIAIVIVLNKCRRVTIMKDNSAEDLLKLYEEQDSYHDDSANVDSEIRSEFDCCAECCSCMRLCCCLTCLGA